MKKLLSLFTACLAMLAASAEDYKLNIGGLEVNSDNYTQLNDLLTESGVLKSGTVEYLPEKNAVVLTNAYLYLKYDNYNSVISSENVEATLTIEVKGECTLLSELFNLGYPVLNVGVKGADKSGNLKIRGRPGSKLNLIGAASSVCCKNLYVLSVTLDVDCYDCAFNAECYFSKAMVIVRQCTEMISNHPISFDEDWGFVYPEDGSNETCSPEYNRLIYTGPNPITAIIRSLDQPFESYDLFIEGKQITELNCDGNLWNNTVSYDPAANTLTLWGATLKGKGASNDEETKYGAAIYSNISGLTINANGNNLISGANTNSTIIYLGKKTDIKGNGDLQCYNGACGINMNSISTLTIGGNVSVIAEGNVSGIQGRARWNASTSELQYFSTLCIKDKAYVSAKGNSNGAFCDWKELLLEDKHSITTPTGAQWSSNSICGSDGLPICNDWVVITAPDIKGDVNNDGSVNTADVVAIYNFIEQGDASGISRYAANVNGDDYVNTADVVAVYDIIIGSSTE